MLLATGCWSKEGESCDKDDACAKGLVCYENHCRSSAERARQATLKKEAEARRKKDLLRQSGVLGLGWPIRCSKDWECDNISHWTPKCHPRLKVCVECVKEEDCPSGRRICSGGRCVLSCGVVLQCVFDLCTYEQCAKADRCTCDPRAVCEVEMCETAAAVERCIRSKCPVCFTRGFEGAGCGQCYTAKCDAELNACGDGC
jgi:hypothetical protein